MKFLIQNNYFYSLSFLFFNINKNNIIIFKILLNNKYKKNYFYFLNFSKNLRYSWCSDKTFFTKIFKINLIDNVLLDSFGVSENFNKNYGFVDKLNDLIIFKKRTLMFKKNYDHKYLILSKTAVKFKNTSLNYKFFKKSDYFYNNKIKSNCTDLEYKNVRNTNYNGNRSTNFNKSFDFSRNIKPLIKKNRILFKNAFNIKFTRQYRLDRYFCKVVKRDSINILISLDYRLCNILLKCQFFNSLSDCIWFIENNFVSVNGSICLDPNKVLNQFDVVNIIIDRYYYNFYKSNFNHSIKVVSRFNSLLWRINKRIYFDTSKNINPNEKLPNWIFNATYFKNDIPKFLEVDYKSMSVVVLKKNKFNNKFDYFSTKFLNVYLMRLYNWKTIV